jgi:hypothetical protein
MDSFKPVVLENRTRINNCLRVFPENETSEYTFTNLFIWSNADCIEWMEGDGFMLLRTRGRYMMAFARRDGLAAALDTAIAVSAAAGESFSMHSLPLWYCELLRELMPGRFEFAREPHLDDYVYNTKDLIELAGKKYHGKRNHINHLMSEYGERCVYTAYEQSMADACMRVYDSWLSVHDNPTAFSGERDSVRRALYNAQALELSGGVVMLDGVPRAFSLGERLTADMAVIHIEKASPEIPELFSLINREFAQTFADMAWINREEDMGDEGLKRAKHSYRPARMIEKYCAVLG